MLDRQYCVETAKLGKNWADTATLNFNGFLTHIVRTQAMRSVNTQQTQNPSLKYTCIINRQG